MRKITICFICVVAFLCLFTSRSKATVHVAMMDEEYLNYQQKQYDERIKKEREEEEKKKAEEARKAEEAKKANAEKSAAKQTSSTTESANGLEDESEAAILKTSKGKGSFTQEEIDILCKICHAESRGEGEKGQMAVANVILNRVKSSKFPNSIKGVVFQSGQFTPAASKSFYSIKPSSQVRASVQKVVNGQRVFADDVLYFKSTNSKANWSNLKLRVKIGGHLFYAG